LESEFAKATQVLFYNNIEFSSRILTCKQHLNLPHLLLLFFNQRMNICEITVYNYKINNI